MPNSRHTRVVVRRQGLEPRFPGLRVQCFTRIARGAQRHHIERHAGVEPAFPAWRAGTLTVVLMPQRGSPRTRTSHLLNFTQPLCPMS
jgi:hypothetical protein